MDYAVMQGGSMYKKSYYLDRVMRYMQRLDRPRSEFRESIKNAFKYKVSHKFANEAFSLVNQSLGTPYDLVECTQKVSQSITRTEAFINRWESKEAMPGYHDVLRYARKYCMELKTLKLVLDDVTQKTLGMTQPYSKGGASLGGIFPASVAIIVGAVLLLVIALVIGLVT